MKLKNLYIRNFGLFHNQALEDLHPGLVVIGGYNRAGKTTFMQILRYLGYGFPQSSSFLQLTNRCDVESTIILEGGEVCNLQITGFAEPLLSYQDTEKTISLGEIYNHLDILTYQQIFSISLDELQRQPKGISPKHVDKIQSILLGAGLADMVKIPYLEESLRKEAEKIGGKNGSPRVREFKPYNLQIKEGLTLREEAWQELDNFQEKNLFLVDLANKLDSSEAEIVELNFQITRLDVLKNNYENCLEKHSLEMMANNLDINPLSKQKFAAFTDGFLEKAKDLRASLLTAEENYQKHLEQLQQRTKTTDLINLKNNLLSSSKEIDKAYQNLSGLQEKLKNLAVQKEHYLQQHAEVVAQMNMLNVEWQGDFQQILKINTDQIQQDLIVQQIEKFRSLQQRQTIYKERLEELDQEKAQLENQSKNMHFSSVEDNLTRFFIWGVVFILAGISASFVTLWLGIVCSLVGILSTGLILVYKYFTQSALRLDKKKIGHQLDNIQLQITDKRQGLRQISDKLDALAEDLETYRQRLGLAKSTSLEMVQHFYRQIPEIKRDIFWIRQLEEKISKDYLELTTEINKIGDLVGKLSAKKINLGDDLSDNSKEVFYALEIIVEDLKIAKELEKSELTFLDLSERVHEFIQIEETEALLTALSEFINLGEKYVEFKKIGTQIEVIKLKILQSLKTDRVRKAFQIKDAQSIDDFRLIQVFERFFNQFTSIEDVQKVYDQAKVRLGALENMVSELKEQRQSIRDEIARLSTTENLNKAQSQIDDARSNLRPLAEKYAIYSGAAFLLNQIKKRFMENTKDTLLSGASKVLKKITAGEYQQILPASDLLEADFQTLASGGKLKKTVEVLSRGTQEQLFLAVRLSRIKEIKPPLPVILDDSLVNFDLPHLRRALDLFIDLAKTHQIFLLTCQPHLAQYITENAAKAQYWCLADGRIEQIEGSALVTYLTAVKRKQNLA